MKEAMRLRRTFHSAFTGRVHDTTLLTVLVLAVFATARVSADGVDSGIIDFDYNYAALGYPAYGPGAAAIGSAGDIWNTATLFDTGPLTLCKTDGTSSSAVWTLSGGGGLGPGPAISGAYAKLFDVSTYISSASITGLTPNQQYNLYLFSAYWDEVINVNGINFTTHGIRFGSVDSLTAESQYDVHTVTADSAGTLAFVPVSAQYGTPYISSWQLQAVPEPDPIWLVGPALAAFAIHRLARPQKRRRWL